MPGRQRIGCLPASDSSGQRHRVRERTRALPDPLGHLVGKQAGRPQRHHPAHRAPLRGLTSRREQARGHREPQLGMVGRAGQRRHDRVEQRGGCVGNRFEQFPIQRPQAPGDLFDAARSLPRPPVHSLHPNQRPGAGFSTGGSVCASLPRGAPKTAGSGRWGVVAAGWFRWSSTPKAGATPRRPSARRGRAHAITPASAGRPGRPAAPRTAPGDRPRPARDNGGPRARWRRRQPAPTCRTGR